MILLSMQKITIFYPGKVSFLKVKTLLLYNITGPTLLTMILQIILLQVVVSHLDALSCPTAVVRFDLQYSLQGEPVQELLHSSIGTLQCPISDEITKRSCLTHSNSELTHTVVKNEFSCWYVWELFFSYQNKTFLDYRLKANQKNRTQGDQSNFLF